MPDRIAHYARQRRAFALMMSAMWVAYGVIVILTLEGAVRSLSWIPNGFSSPHIAGMGFVLLGLITAILAYESQEHRRLEGWAYGLLTAGPLLMGVLSMIAAALDYNPKGWASGFRFMMFAAIAFYMAGLRPSNAELRKGSMRRAHG